MAEITSLVPAIVDVKVVVVNGGTPYVKLAMVFFLLEV